MDKGAIVLVRSFLLLGSKVCISIFVFISKTAEVLKGWELLAPFLDAVACDPDLFKKHLSSSMLS